MIGFLHICVAMKPLEGNFARNALKNGVAGLNIDGCRVETVDRFGGGARMSSSGHTLNKFGGYENDGFIDGNPQGRFPANLIHDGSADVVRLFPANAGASAPVRGKEPSTTGQKGIYGHFDRVAGPFHGDSGSASRFFKQVDET